MLTVTSSVGPTHTRTVDDDMIGLIADDMISINASFYVEPLPDSTWSITVAQEHASYLDNFADAYAPFGIGEP